jgi:signal transduction histidine kinase
VATAQTAGDEALRRSLEASESERARWARELHDETLQAMAGLRVLLSGARRSGDPDRIMAAKGDAIDLLEHGIADQRALITDLRPAALDELGTQAALETLIARVAQQSGLEIELEFESDTLARHSTEIESTMYRLVQEGLTNVVKHARATRVDVRVIDTDETVEILLRDDGEGFDPTAGAAGFGLIGMRERVSLVHGTLDIESAAGSGTTLRARIPLRRREAGVRSN